MKYYRLLCNHYKLYSQKYFEMWENLSIYYQSKTEKAVWYDGSFAKVSIWVYA